MQLTIEKKRLAAVTMLMAWSTTLCLYRIYRDGDMLATGMLWNLFLAFVPLLWSAAFQSALARGQRLGAVMWFALWLLFLPNAPYMVTDLIHLDSRPHVPEWYMLAMLMSCAGTGLVLAYLSLHDIQLVVQQRLGAGAGWALAALALTVSAHGVYVGRFLRWNSWNALTSPLQLLESIAGQFIDPGPHPHPAAVTLVYGVALMIGYIALQMLCSSTRTPSHDAPAS